MFILNILVVLTVLLSLIALIVIFIVTASRLSDKSRRSTVNNVPKGVTVSALAAFGGESESEKFELPELPNGSHLNSDFYIKKKLK